MNKRTNTRMYKRLFVRYGEELPTYIGYTTDISSTGIFIKASKLFPPETRLKIALTLPDDRVVFLTGSVVWAKRVPQQLYRMIRKAGMGVTLESPDPSYLSILN